MAQVLMINGVTYNGVDSISVPTSNGSSAVRYVDPSADTVTPETLAEGATAHGADGEPIVGTMPTAVVRYDAPQQLTEKQKAQARENIGVGAFVAEEISKAMSDADEELVDVLQDVGYQEGMRINSSGAIVATNGNGSDATNYIPCKTGDVIRLENVDFPSTYASGCYWNLVAAYDANKAHKAQCFTCYDDKGRHEAVELVEENGMVVQFTIADSVFGSDVAYIAISAKDITAESKIYVNSANINTDSTTTTTIPDYWLPELETKATEIQTAMEAAGRNKSAFLWYTDAHWQTNSKMSPVLLDYIIRNTPMNKINFGGDIINDPASFTHSNINYVYEWRKLIADLPNHHSVPGNHDVNHNTTDVRNMTYAFLLATEESADMVCGDGMYYYIDNPSERTRYLYLSFPSNDVNENLEQGKFIVEAINGVKEGWHIVAITHSWFQYTSASAPTVGVVPSFQSDVLSVFDAYNARETRSGSNWFYEQDFTNAKGKVEFCIGGHIHVDYDFTSDGGIPVIITASDTNQERSGDETEDCGTIGTITESAVFGIIADYTNHVITVVGIGRGGSRVVG